MSWEMWAAGSEDEDPLMDDQHEYAHEDELREDADQHPLGGADVDHCQRIRD